MSRPGGNLTGFSNFEFSLIGKWLQALKEVSPGIRRVALIMHPENATFQRVTATFRADAPTFGVEPMIVPVRMRSDLEQSITAFAQDGLLVPGDTFMQDNIDLAIALANRHRLPAVY